MVSEIWELKNLSSLTATQLRVQQSQIESEVLTACGPRFQRGLDGLSSVPLASSVLLFLVRWKRGGEALWH